MSGYALPALSPKKKLCWRKKHDARIEPGYSLFSRNRHSRESCCNDVLMSILEISVTCDTKSVDGKHVDMSFAGAVLIVVVGLAIYEAYVILAVS